MCGIFGWSFTRRARIPQVQRETLASVLAVANALRGDQSWGVYAAPENGPARIKREVGDIRTVSGFGSTFGALGCVMAHTRFATTGRITRENQHPFKVGKILLAHNGVIFNHDELNEKHARSYPVDSMHFAAHLDAGLPFDDIEGYGALEWIEDPASRGVNLARLAGGSLSVFGIKNERGKTVGVAWSSDKAHLESAIGAARLDAFPYEALKEGQRYQATGGRFLVIEKTPLLALGCYRAPITRRAWSWRNKHWDMESQRWVEVDEGLYADSEGNITGTPEPEPEAETEEDLWRAYGADEETRRGLHTLTESEWNAREELQREARANWYRRAAEKKTGEKTTAIVKRTYCDAKRDGRYCRLSDKHAGPCDFGTSGGITPRIPCDTKGCWRPGGHPGAHYLDMAAARATT